MTFNTIVFNKSDDIYSQLLPYQEAMIDNSYTSFSFNIFAIMNEDNYIDYLNEIHLEFNAIFEPLFRKEDMLFNELMNPLYLGLLDYFIVYPNLEKQKKVLNHPIFSAHLDKYCEIICTPHTQLFTSPSFINDQFFFFEKMITHYDIHNSTILSDWFLKFEPHLEKINKYFRLKNGYKLSEHMLEFVFHELINEKEVNFDSTFYINNCDKLNQIISSYSSFTQHGFQSLSLNIADFFIAPETYGYSSNHSEASKELDWIFNLLTAIISPHWKNVEWHFPIGIQLINQNKFKNYLIEHDEVFIFLNTIKEDNILNFFNDNLSILNKWDNALFYLLDNMNTHSKECFNLFDISFIQAHLPKTYLLFEKKQLDNESSLIIDKKIKNKL